LLKCWFSDSVGVVVRGGGWDNGGKGGGETHCVGDWGSTFFREKPRRGVLRGVRVFSAVGKKAVNCIAPVAPARWDLESRRRKWKEGRTVKLSAGREKGEKDPWRKAPSAVKTPPRGGANRGRKNGPPQVAVQWFIAEGWGKYPRSGVYPGQERGTGERSRERRKIRGIRGGGPWVGQEENCVKKQGLNSNCTAVFLGKSGKGGEIKGGRSNAPAKRGQGRWRPCTNPPGEEKGNEWKVKVKGGKPYGIPTPEQLGERKNHPPKERRAGIFRVNDSPLRLVGVEKVEGEGKRKKRGSLGAVPLKRKEGGIRNLRTMHGFPNRLWRKRP